MLLKLDHQKKQLKFSRSGFCPHGATPRIGNQLQHEVRECSSLAKSWYVVFSECGILARSGC